MPSSRIPEWAKNLVAMAKPKKRASASKSRRSRKKASAEDSVAVMAVEEKD